VGSSVALETARSGRVDMVRNMGRNCYGGICRAISLEGGGDGRSVHPARACQSPFPAGNRGDRGGVTGALVTSRFPDIWDPLARVFDAWGFDRCLWGTDWTRAFAVVNYEQAVESFLKTDRLSDSERAMLMGGACAKAYNWSPKKVSAV
jgi:Amidohydrolase